MATSVKLLLKNKPRSDFTFPIVLQVIKDGKAKVISTGINCNKTDWTGLELKRTHPNFQKRNLILMNIKQRALKIIDDFIEEGIDFTLNDFEKIFKGDKQNSRITVFEHFQDVIQRMKLSNRLGNAKSYHDTCNSFFKFHIDRDLTFKGLNVTLLERYEAYLRNRNNQDSGIAFKMRALRALYNSAIRNDIVSKDYYPFDKYKISKLKGKGIKELNGYSIGDQLVHVNIWTPKQLTIEESELLEKLRNSANFAPQPGKSDKGFFHKVKDMFS